MMEKEVDYATASFRKAFVHAGLGDYKIPSVLGALANAAIARTHPYPLIFAMQQLSATVMSWALAAAASITYIPTACGFV
jgi:hypothetical protein